MYRQNPYYNYPRRNNIPFRGRQRNTRNRTNYFVPNLSQEPFQSRNLRIQPMINRNRSQPNRRTNRNRRNLNTPLPFFRNVNIKPSLKMQMNKNQCTINIKTPIDPNHTIGSLCVIPIHPLFFNQRLLNQAVNWSQYRVNSVTIITKPTVAVTDPTVIAIGYTTHCSPITQDVTLHYDKITSLDGVQGMAHTSLTYTIPVKDNIFHPIVPIVPSDVPFTFFVAPNLSNIVTKDKILIYVQMSLTFQTPYTSDELDLNLCSDNALVTTIATDIQSNVILPTTFGFCNYSTIPNIDCGELIIMPSFPAITTPYLFPIVHNGAITNYIDEPNDRGNLVWIRKNIN